MASQQAPARPWFRLASMNRPTAPAPAPATLAQPQPPARQPRLPFVRPTPPVAVAPPATASPPPQPQPPSHISAAATTTPTSSPKIISPLAKPTPISPEMKPVSTPPSTLVLSPAQIKFDGKPETKIPAQAQQKTILMQETFEEHKVIPNTSIVSFEKHVNVVHNGESQVKINTETKDHKSFYKNYSDSEDFRKSVVTLSGENRGAIMELSLHKRGNSIALISNGQKSERDSNEEGRSNMNDKTHKMVSPLKKTTFINSNVQGVNNSILLDCSFTHHDPGVHLSLSSKANASGRGAQLKD